MVVSPAHPLLPPFAPALRRPPIPQICAEASIIFPLLVAETFARTEPESDDEDDAAPLKYMRVGAAP